MKLVILESPNKIEKVQHYLGGGYQVMATAGHFRDLPQRELGIDLASFAPTYVVSEKKKDLLARIKAKAKDAGEVLLATDADREGEAISWHLAEELRLTKPMRLRYTEITEKGIKTALAGVSPLDQDLVDAQQARRILDRLVGYQVSPQLRAFGENHSAGRVQSATLHLVVARELERLGFRPEDYWTLVAHYGNGLTARNVTPGEKGELVDARLETAAHAEAIATRTRVAQHVVRSVETAPKERRPRPPFTTSTLQQAASAVLDMKPDCTMALAQKLFESGTITYHRTDSVALSDDAVAMARAFIEGDYPAALPSEPVRYRAKAGAQGAHEAIRPTSLEPTRQPKLQGEEAGLYDLIRRRFIACQCKPAVLMQTTVLIAAADTTWRAVGSIVHCDGFLHYLADEEEPQGEDRDGDGKLPRVQEGELLQLEKIEVLAKQTKPPPRYTQATLIKAMEATGIGRPSTYASTVRLLFDRVYTAEEKKNVYPTERGFLVDEMLGKAYPELLATETTAALESRLDEIAEGKRSWLAELRDWYGPFAKKLAAAPQIFARELGSRPEIAARAPSGVKPTGKPCPLCGKELLLRPRKKGDGSFLSCSGYPICAYAANPDARRSGRKCPRCERELLLVARKNGDGDYLTCPGYGEKNAKGERACSYIADPSAKASEHSCPKCQGSMEELSGRFGAYARCLKAGCGGVVELAPLTSEPCPFCEAPMRDKGKALSCSRYPQCRGYYDKAALARSRREKTICPECGKPLLRRKGPRGPFLGCAAYPKCRYICNSTATRSPANSS